MVRGWWGPRMNMLERLVGAGADLQRFTLILEVQTVPAGIAIENGTFIFQGPL